MCEGAFDVEAVREQFPALGRTYHGRRVAYLDGPGGSQVARGAIEAVAGYMTCGGANLHGAFVTSRETEIIAGARRASAAFLGAELDEVAFGHNMTTLTLAVSRALSRGWKEGDEVVVTEIDHRANVDPWVLAAAHIPIDRDALGADVLTCSAYKFFGPHVGVTAIRRDFFEAMEPYKPAPGPGRVPDKLETGTQNHEGLAGVEAAISFIASLGSGATLREGLVSGMGRVEAYEDGLADRARARLREMPGLTLHAAPEGVRKTPTLAFRLEGRSPLEVCEHMSERGIFVAGGDFYATILADKLGIGATGGFVRAGLAPYNTAGEVDAFLEALGDLAAR